MKKKISGVLAFLMFLSVFINTFSIEAEAVENYVTAIRDVNPGVITPDGEAEINIKVTGKPPVNVVKPNDVVLILDKSGSMQNDNRFGAMKDSAKEFVDLIDFDKHNLGLVDFSSTNYVGTKGLTNDANSLKNYIDGIECGGGTETGYAIREAAKLLENERKDAQPVILLLTDGQANSSSDALKAAEEAKNAGIVFYTIALLGPNENPDTSSPNILLKDMATTSSHHHFVLGSVGLIDIYRAIVNEIGVASAYNVKITEEVSPEFEIVPGSYDNNIPKPHVDGNTLTWNILELKADTLELSYKIRPKSDTPVGKYNVASKSVITYKNYEGNEQTYDIPNKVLEIKNHPPVITSVTNNSSHANGGEKIIIKGSNFRNGAKVSINNNECTNVVFIDSNTIEAVTPPGVQGNTILTVTNDDNQKAKAEFSYYGNQDITITNISPNSGNVEGGEIINIYGTNFLNSNDLSVEIGGNKAPLEHFYGSKKLSIKVPANNTPGKYDVVFINGDGQKLTVKDGYEYLTPPPVLPLEVKSISNTSGYEEGGNYIYITGQGFLKESIVTIGGNVTPTSYVADTKIGVKVPKGIPGDVEVIVTNPDGECVAAPMKYTYIERVAEITSLNRIEGKIEGGELVYIYGKDFINDIEVFFGENKAELLNYYNTGKIRVRVPAVAVAGDVDVKIINGNGKSVTKVNAYKYLATPILAPTISQITPNVGSIKGGELVYILGTNFVNGDDLSVEIGGNKVDLLNYYNTGKIRVRIPSNSTPGKYDVVVTNGDGQKVTVVDGYEYLAPITVN
ncbi:IPT/TIG domain-containing protein [Clostridium sp. UBA3061]|uniref:IPT/TIG domain-containing protein n=1 Tax=Clostridium sp. UBA3061 TaxID=1946353 RepID=UPI0032180E44